MFNDIFKSQREIIKLQVIWLPAARDKKRFCSNNIISSDLLHNSKSNKKKLKISNLKKTRLIYASIILWLNSGRAIFSVALSGRINLSDFKDHEMDFLSRPLRRYILFAVSLQSDCIVPIRVTIPPMM